MFAGQASGRAQEHLHFANELAAAGCRRRDTQMTNEDGVDALAPRLADPAKGQQGRGTTCGDDAVEDVREGLVVDDDGHGLVS
jgi:hypothetical protein